MALRRYASDSVAFARRHDESALATLSTCSADRGGRPAAIESARDCSSRRNRCANAFGDEAGVRVLEHNLGFWRWTKLIAGTLERRSKRRWRSRRSTSGTRWPTRRVNLAFAELGRGTVRRRARARFTAGARGRPSNGLERSRRRTVSSVQLGSTSRAARLDRAAHSLGAGRPHRRRHSADLRDLRGKGAGTRRA